MKMIKFMTGYEEVIELSINSYTTPYLDTGLFVGKVWVFATQLLPSHPNINLPVMNKLATIMHSSYERSFRSSLLRAFMEKFALWLKKCLLMQHMTRKSELQLLMATG